MFNEKIRVDILSKIKSLASTIPIGNSRYYDCPQCNRKNKFGITHNVDGLVYNCFSASCKLRGKATKTLNKDSISQILNNKLQHHQRKFELPEYLLPGFASDASLALATKYDLLTAYSNKAFQTYYDPKLHRQVFLHTDLEGNVVGAMGRALNNTTFPKAYIYPNSEKTPWIIGYNPVADHKIGVVVEDILSAVKLYNIGFTGIALSGTKLALDYVKWFEKYETIIICLDKDASILSLKLKKLLDIYVEYVKIVLIQRDFKDLSREEARKVLYDTRATA